MLSKLQNFQHHLDSLSVVGCQPSSLNFFIRLALTPMGLPLSDTRSISKISRHIGNQARRVRIWSHHFVRFAPLPSNRRHLSYDVCLEIRGEIIRTVLCCIVY